MSGFWMLWSGALVVVCGWLSGQLIGEGRYGRAGVFAGLALINLVAYALRLAEVLA